MSRASRRLFPSALQVSVWQCGWKIMVASAGDVDGANDVIAHSFHSVSCT